MEIAEIEVAFNLIKLGMCRLRAIGPPWSFIN